MVQIVSFIVKKVVLVYIPCNIVNISMNYILYLLFFFKAQNHTFDFIFIIFK